MSTAGINRSRKFQSHGSRIRLKRIYVDPAWIASGYAFLGEKDRAFALLEKAYAEKSGFLPSIKCAVDFDSLRTDPRYAGPAESKRTVIGRS